ncbi:phage tail protein (plasmid) [Streptomyces sp. QH1-20]|uniref:phage tail protein n=1 Tax=Streptomyces sp. QH1-20 TaxID=3240934 RepID=UPI003510D41A
MESPPQAAATPPVAPPAPPLVPGSRSLRAILPESYRQGDFADRFIAGFDDALAPLITTLDCLDAYFSPRTAPEHFVTWMLSWSNTALPACVGMTGRRNALLLGHQLHGLRGTAAGLDLLVRYVLGGRLELTESGGTHYAARPDDPAVRGPGPAGPRAQVRVLLPYGTVARHPGAVDDLTELVREWIPAHVYADVTIEDDEDPLLVRGAAGGAY